MSNLCSLEFSPLLQQGLSLGSPSGIKLVPCWKLSVFTFSESNNVQILSLSAEGSWWFSNFIFHDSSSYFTCSRHIVHSLFLDHTVCFLMSQYLLTLLLLPKMPFLTPQTPPFKISLFLCYLKCQPVLSFSLKWVLPPQNPNSLCFSFSSCSPHYSVHSNFCIHLPFQTIYHDNPPEAPLTVFWALKMEGYSDQESKSWSAGRILQSYLSTGSWTLW